jgi:hypothetical protein
MTTCGLEHPKRLLRGWCLLGEKMGLFSSRKMIAKSISPMRSSMIRFVIVLISPGPLRSSVYWMHSFRSLGTGN